MNADIQLALAVLADSAHAVTQNVVAWSGLLLDKDNHAMSPTPLANPIPRLASRRQLRRWLDDSRRQVEALEPKVALLTHNVNRLTTALEQAEQTRADDAYGYNAALVESANARVEAEQARAEAEGRLDRLSGETVRYMGLLSATVDYFAQAEGLAKRNADLIRRMLAAPVDGDDND